MENRNQVIFGSLILLAGVLVLIGNVFHVDVGALCWPGGLILLGVYLLVRPRLRAGGMPVNIRPFGTVRRSGPFRLENEEVWMFAGDVNLDLNQAEIPPGETVVRVYSFVGDINIRLAGAAGFALYSTGFITSAKIQGRKQDSFVTPVRFATPGYETSERRVRLETLGFINDVDIA